MSLRKTNRTRLDRSRLNRSTRRGLEAIFWIMLLLAAGVGGPGALAGFPALAGVIAPPEIFEAQASAEWQDVVIRPISRVTSRVVASAIAPIGFGKPVQPAVALPAGKPLPAIAPAIAIVIDDMGGDAVQNRRAIALPKEVSLSFLPYPDTTPRLAEEAHRAGHEVLVHVPMEAPGERENALQWTLRSDLPAEENVRRLESALARVPGFAGINNHEGSVFTADRLALIPVVEALYGRGVYFLDSRTTPLTQVVPVARAFGVRSSDRDVFLDDDKSSPAVERQLQELEQTARAQGVAIAIGHPHAATLDILARWCAARKGFRLVPVSTAIRLKTEWDMGVELASGE